jgi:hypothetical protein
MSDIQSSRAILNQQDIFYYLSPLLVNELCLALEIKASSHCSDAVYSLLCS